MLVLTRKPGEDVVIACGDETIRVVVVKDELGRMKLGFVANRHVAIRRGELPPLERPRALPMPRPIPN